MIDDRSRVCDEYSLEPAPGPEGRVTAEEFSLRVDGLRKAMAHKGIDAAILHHSRDLLYYAGTALHCHLVIPLESAPVLLVRINAAQARRDSWISDIRESAGPGDVRDVLSGLGLEGAGIGIEEDVTNLALFRRFEGLLPHARFVDISTLILSQRMVKSPAEIAMVRRAAMISAIGLRRAREVMRPGVSEVSLAGEIELAKRQAGHDGVMIGRRAGVTAAVLAASGSNTEVISGYWVSIVGPGLSEALPHGPSLRKMEKDDLVVVDHGTMYRGYHADQGRTFVLGKATDRQKRLFDVVRRAQDAALEKVKPGVPASDVYRAAREVVLSAGEESHFMGFGQYGVEYLGHGVGLEIDEGPQIGPRNGTLLEEGMTLALEPKLIIPGWGGVDLEDTIVVTCSGYDMLTQGPRELVEVID